MTREYRRDSWVHCANLPKMVLFCGVGNEIMIESNINLGFDFYLCGCLGRMFWESWIIVETLYSLPSGHWIFSNALDVTQHGLEDRGSFNVRSLFRWDNYLKLLYGKVCNFLSKRKVNYTCSSSLSAIYSLRKNTLISRFIKTFVFRFWWTQFSFK